jgi:hypothetical protein
MGMIVVGLMKDAHQARGVVRALDDEGFEREEIDVSSGLLTELIARGVPEEEAPVYAEGARRGGMLVFVSAEDDDEAAEAAELMAEHGAVDIDACATGWQQGQTLVFGEYPAAPGRIYYDPRYTGPERRERDEPYAGADRRLA